MQNNYSIAIRPVFSSTAKVYNDDANSERNVLRPK
jgi:hypothetical protein